MNFQAGHLYRHDCTLDMDLFVRRVVTKTDSHIILKVQYWNRGYKMFQPDRLSWETVRVKREDMKHWREVG